MPTTVSGWLPYIEGEGTVCVVWAELWYILLSVVEKNGRLQGVLLGRHHFCEPDVKLDEQQGVYVTESWMPTTVSVLYI